MPPIVDIAITMDSAPRCDLLSTDCGECGSRMGIVLTEMPKGLWSTIELQAYVCPECDAA